MDNQILPLLQEIRGEQGHILPRLDQIDVKIDVKFDEIDRKFSQIDAKFEDLSSRFRLHERFMGTLMELISQDSSHIADFKVKLESFEKRLAVTKK